MVNQPGIGSHQSHIMGTDEWLTPPHILEALGKFDLDPCAPINRPWDTAYHHYTILDDGLEHQWTGRVWCNPPYGPKTKLWLSRLADHGQGIALVFARTETRMFFSEVWPKASGILFIEGRLHFHHLDGSKAKANSGGPSALISYGKSDADVLQNCHIAGKFLRLTNESGDGIQH
jgi:hypothetical protein